MAVQLYYLVDQTADVLTKALDEKVNTPTLCTLTMSKICTFFLFDHSAEPSQEVLWPPARCGIIIPPIPVSSILEHPGQYTIWYSPLDSGGTYPSLSILSAPLMPRNMHFQRSHYKLLTFVSPANSFIQDHFLKLTFAGWNGVF